MKHLPLYNDTSAVVEKVTPIHFRDEKCTRCKLHETARTVCMPADAVRFSSGYEGGAVLVLGEFPTASEDAARRPVSSGPNGLLRELLEGLIDGPIVYASALRCAPGKTKPTDSIMEACRPYTLGLIEEIKPSRILCFGKRAYQMVLGSSCDPIQLGRRGYGYLSDGTPVFMFSGAARVTPNRFLWKRFEKDVAWAITADPELPPWDYEISQVETPEDSAEACASLADAGEFTYDTETGGMMGDAEYFQVVCLTATADGDEGVWLWGEEALKDPAILAPLQELMRNAAVKKIGHNLKFDFEAVAFGLGLRDERGVLEVKGVAADTMLWVKGFDTEAVGKLDHCDHHVGMGGHKAENAAALASAKELIGRARAKPDQRMLPGMQHPALAAAVRHKDIKPETFAYALIPRDILYRYCALDTVATARLHERYSAMVTRMPSMQLVTDELLLPPTAAVAQIEAWGMSADVDAARAFGNMLRPKRDEVRDKIRALGCTADLGSPQQMVQYLFGDLGLPVQEVSEKTGVPKVDKWTLAKLQDHHAVIPLLMEYSKLAKLLSTYVDGLIPHIHDDGRVRSSLNLAGARSGRMSSSYPNLQNIPSQGQWAKMAKSIFNAPEGHVIVQLDYSQLEVRIAAMLSQDPDLIQVYLDGVDVHRRTAARAFGVAEKDVTKDIRFRAKAVVFGVMYGKTPVSLAKDLGVSINKAEEIYNAVLGVYSVLHRWLKDQVATCERTGTTWTYIPKADGKLERARCRQLWQIADPDSKAASRARNGSKNTPIQGSASDFMLRTLCAVVDWLIADGIPARVTNTVHDSIIMEVPYAWALEVSSVVQSIMEGWPSAGVPLVADVDIGLTWGSLFKLGGLTTVGAGRRRNMTDAEIIHLVQADPDLAEEMGDDPVAWLKKATELALLIGA